MAQIPMRKSTEWNLAPPTERFDAKKTKKRRQFWDAVEITIFIADITAF